MTANANATKEPLKECQQVHKCSNCHPQVFEMKAGSNPINMDAMRAGLYCAKCHNGKIAWEIGFETCQRCHQETLPP